MTTAPISRASWRPTSKVGRGLCTLGGDRGLWRVGMRAVPYATGNSGQLLWNDNWVTFLDAMLQVSILGHSQRSLRLPTRITALHIDPATHLRKVHSWGEAQGKPPVPTVPH